MVQQMHPYTRSLLGLYCRFPYKVQTAAWKRIIEIGDWMSSAAEYERECFVFDGRRNKRSVRMERQCWKQRVSFARFVRVLPAADLFLLHFRVATTNVAHSIKVYLTKWEHRKESSLQPLKLKLLIRFEEWWGLKSLWPSFEGRFGLFLCR